MSGYRSLWLGALLALMWLLPVGGSRAATVSVGPGQDCSYGAIQDAIDDLPASGNHLIKIGGQNYTGIHLTISNQHVTLMGGFLHCSDTSPTYGPAATRLDASPHTGDSVIYIDGSDVAVELNNLTVQNGSLDGSGHGGGINFVADGSLTLNETVVQGNHAGYGAGISVSPTHAATVMLGQLTQVLDNTAAHSGGGIRIEGHTTLNVTPYDMQIASNTASDGYGGGVEVIGPARANLSSSGLNGQGAVYNNTARYGGGVSVTSGPNNGDDAVLQLWGMQPGAPSAITGNLATENGGGVYLKPLGVSGIAGSKTAQASLCARNFAIDGNDAREGTGIYADSDSQGVTVGSRVLINSMASDPACASFGDMPSNGVACAPGLGCNSVSNGYARDSGGAITNGAEIYLASHARLFADRVQLRSHAGGPVLYVGNDNGEQTYLSNCLVTGNIVFPDDGVVHTHGNSPLQVTYCTIVSNVLNTASSPVFALDDDLSLSRSIITQIGHPTVHETDSGSAISSIYVLASETASINGGPTVLNQTPLFVDTSRNDFHLQAGSYGIDMAPAAGGVDLAGALRDVQLQLVPDFIGTSPADIGALETQSIGNLAGNGNFDGDFHLWYDSVAGTTVWDGTQDAVGTANSGSAEVSGPTTSAQTVVSGASQCIHLPGPGDYRLNAWGLAAGPVAIYRDVPGLHWVLRRDSSDCSGTVYSQGDLHMPRGTTWAQAAQPQLITVANGIWTHRSTLQVTLTATDTSTVSPGGSSATAWIDGITLLFESDGIFADGFGDTH